jgi:hypothetical protein
MMQEFKFNLNTIIINKPHEEKYLVNL